jgi:signal transduction histidine kinase
MSGTDPRLERDFCARGFLRASQYFANMLTSADVLAESRALIHGVFGPDLVCFCRRPAEGGASLDLKLPPSDGAMLSRAIDQAMDTGLMAMEQLGGAPPMACVVLPVTVRGRAEVALLVGYSGTTAVPPHALDALLGVVGLVGATRARQLAERELLALAEERAARAQAQEAIRLRDEFLAVASHELKTPLTAFMLVIDGVERTVERMPHPPELMRKKVAILSRQARRLDKLVTDLLDVARIQAGRLHVAVEDVDLCEVVREVVERQEQQAASARCALEVVAGRPIVGVWDRSRVDQVVSNLLSNALKYGAGKPVTVAAEAADGIARLSVTDRGIGIAPEDHARVFQRFERAVGEGFGGMGLGLWITREIVARLGGTIRVESALGEGARFTVELPLRPPEPTPAPR